MKGSYILLINIPSDIKVSIGVLGDILFNEGYYLYIGSAMGNYGSSTLVNRVKRHIVSPRNKKVRWHIDYLLNHERSLITRLYLIPSLVRLECIIAQEVSKICDNSIQNFGSSDCQCISHLFYFENFGYLKQKL